MPYAAGKLSKDQAVETYGDISESKALTYLIATITGALPDLAFSEAAILYKDKVYILDVTEYELKLETIINDYNNINQFSINKRKYWTKICFNNC